MATTASRFLKFIAVHGLPGGFMIAGGIFSSRYFFYVWKENETGVAETLELLPAFFIAGVAGGILAGILLWIFRRKEYGY